LQDSTPGRVQGDVAAKLTAYDSGTGYYSWTEQAFTTTGTRYDKPGGLSGTATYMPAIPLGSANGFQPTDFPVQVWLRPVIVAGNLGQVWEILGSTIEVDLVEKICVTSYGGYITDVSIQKGTYKLFGTRVEAAACSAGDTNCCPVVVSCSGSEYAIPRTLTLHAECTCCSPYEFDVTLEYSDDVGLAFGAGWYGFYNPNGTELPCQQFFIGCDNDTPPTYDDMILVAWDFVGGGTVYKQELTTVTFDPFYAEGITSIEYTGGATCSNLPIGCSSVSVTITE
jgi:hypothetical protein